jgi:hypothetical protein
MGKPKYLEFIMEEPIDYEGPCRTDVSIDDPNYENYIKRIAAGECYLVSFPTPSIETLGKDGYYVYCAEVERLQLLKEKRREAALRGLKTRMKNLQAKIEKEEHDGKMVNLSAGCGYQ